MANGASDPIAPLELLDRARDIGSIGKVLGAGISLLILGIATGIQNFLNAVVNFFSAPVFEGGVQGANVITAFVGGIATVIQAGAVQTAVAIGAQGTGLVGVLAFVYGVAVAGGAAFAMGWILSASGTSDFVLGLATNFPFVGTTERDPEES